MGRILRAVQMFKGHVGERDVLNLAGLLKTGEGFHGSVERDSGIGDVELVDGYAVEAQALEAAFNCDLKVLRAGIVDRLAGPTRSQPPLVPMTRLLGYERVLRQSVLQIRMGRRSQPCQ